VILAKVLGNVITAARVDGIEGSSYMIVTPCTPSGIALDGTLIALDLMGSSVDEFVLVSQGSSTRQTDITKDKPIDAIIMGIVDIVEEKGKVVFKK
jgi:microcompartment protein CcmK/EutM